MVTILVLDDHYDEAVEIVLAEHHANDTKAYHLAMAGLNFAKAILASDTNDYDAPNELWYNLETFGCIAPGDLMAVPGTGAYCRSMASNYNHALRPPVVAVKDGATTVVVRRESVDDLLRTDVGA